MVQYYIVIVDNDKYIYILQQVRRDILLYGCCLKKKIWTRVDLLSIPQSGGKCQKV